MAGSRLRTFTFRSITALALTGLLAACAGAPEAEDAPAAVGASASPTEVSSCGHTTKVTSAPSRMVTLNQGATEVALALGLQDRMAGTAYLDDPEIAAQFAQAYASVPVLSKEYPTREDLLAADPDFVYASYGSAFEDKAAGSQDGLAKAGIGSYLSPFGCLDDSLKPKTSFAAVWSEIQAVASVFGVSERGEQVVQGQRQTLEKLAAEKAGAGLNLFWYDSGDKTPLAGTGAGGPELVIESVGAKNVFAGVDDNWGEVSWEDVVAADPDVIVLADASWSTAQEKIDYLRKDPVLSKLGAVRAQRFVVVPYSQSTPGATLADGAVSLAKGLAELNQQ